MVQFDTGGIDKLCDCVDVKSAPRLNDQNYQPRGGTPLHDALGKTLVSTRESAGNNKVLFVILTDGQENSSHEWDEDKVKELMKELEDKDQWTFAYIGIGPEAWAAQARLSAGLISASNVMRATQGQTKAVYGAMAGATMSYQASCGSGMTAKFWSGHDKAIKSKAKA